MDHLPEGLYHVNALAVLQACVTRLWVHVLVQKARPAVRSVRPGCRTLSSIQIHFPYMSFLHNHSALYLMLLQVRQPGWTDLTAGLAFWWIMKCHRLLQKWRTWNDVGWPRNLTWSIPANNPATANCLTRCGSWSSVHPVIFSTCCVHLTRTHLTVVVH